jgi:DNA-binding transcriptional MocR family regulator
MSAPVSEQSFSVQRTRFAMVPEWVDEVVTDGTALRVYVRLARKYANTSRECHPSQKSLADELGLGVTTVETALRRLREVGAVVVRRTDRGDGKFGRNEYWLPLDQPSQTRVGADQGERENQPPNPRGGPASESEGSITRPTKATREKTPVADAPEQIELPLAVPAVPEKTAKETEAQILNKRATRAAQWYYERLGKMGNVAAFQKIIKQAMAAGYPDERIRIALTTIADGRWPLTGERLHHTIEGGPRPASSLAAPRKVYLASGMELQQ